LRETDAEVFQFSPEVDELPAGIDKTLAQVDDPRRRHLGIHEGASVSDKRSSPSLTASFMGTHGVASHPFVESTRCDRH
jgi:hypothetical protein